MLPRILKITALALGVGTAAQAESLGDALSGAYLNSGLLKQNQALLRAADELHRDAYVSDRTWAELEARYDTRQLMDVVFTVGQYTLVSMALKSFRVPLDEGVEGFPK